MSCVLCSTPDKAAVLVRVPETTVIGSVCLSCRNRFANGTALHSPATCNLCDSPADYALQSQGGPLVEAGRAESNDIVLSTEQFGILCEDHFEREQ